MPCVPAWIDASADGGRAGYGKCFPSGEYRKVDRPVVGPQRNNRAEVSAVRPVVGPQRNNRAEVSVVRAVLQTVHTEKDIEICSDSQWCKDILKSIEMFKRRKWYSKSKQLTRHHDIWEDIYAMLRV